MEEQIQQFLDSLAIKSDIETCILNELTASTEQSKKEEHARQQSLERALDQVDAQLSELTGLRLRNLLTDSEFVQQRQKLQKDRANLRANLAKLEGGGNAFEPFSDVISFSSRAADWFARGDDQSKRLILETVGSNLFLANKKLHIQAKKPFEQLAKMRAFPRRRAIIDDVRTSFDEPGCESIVHNIKVLRERFEPHSLGMAA